MGLIQEITGSFWTTVETRFWAKVEKGAPSDCWHWQATKNQAGYGTIQICKRHCYAHRVSYELSIGPISDGLIIMHTCDNPSCVNPAHLVMGTQLENMRDKIAKGRHRFPGCSLPKEQNPASKITSQIAQEIKQSYDPKEGYRKLGKRFGISKSQAYRIVAGQSW